MDYQRDWISEIFSCDYRKATSKLNLGHLRDGLLVLHHLRLLLMCAATTFSYKLSRSLDKCLGHVTLKEAPQEQLKQERRKNERK